MSSFQRVLTAQKALFELGPGQTWLYAWYKLKLRSGYLRYRTNHPSSRPGTPYSLKTQLLQPLPDPSMLQDLLGKAGVEVLVSEADEIVSGQVRLFGDDLVQLTLEPPKPVRHWTEYERRKHSGGLPDLKLIWEPARFAWACILGRAYHLTQDERYPEAFWAYTECFLDANPPYLGAHWISAQEAALRLISLIFSFQVMAASPHSTPELQSHLAQAIVDHAVRIPPTMTYGRAQNNNHLLTEALGLFTAGTVLVGYPQVRRWRDLGWRWLNFALQTQIAPDGAYVQHSTNYHRLMLQAALWAFRLANTQGIDLPEATLQRLASATGWLVRLLDPVSARLPNLGPNDGANILPLATSPFHDYRPVLQAACRAFTGSDPFDSGPWSELSLWTCPQASAIPASSRRRQVFAIPPDQTPYRLDNPASASWIYYRVAKFKGRPGHADQLHVDLWWRGLNLAQDAGTYLYNDPPPWDNSLARTAVHNTITINDHDQMTHAGRFLWLDWAQAELLAHDKADDGSWERLTAVHEGYHRLGVTHQRSVKAEINGQWIVEDALFNSRPAKNHAPFTTARLHWLLPGWPWEIDTDSNSAELCLASPLGQIRLRLAYLKTDPQGSRPSFMLVKAGKLVFGSGQVDPTWGWSSDTYAHKIPALSFSLIIRGTLPINLSSEWKLI